MTLCLEHDASPTASESLKGAADHDHDHDLGSPSVSFAPSLSDAEVSEHLSYECNQIMIQFKLRNRLGFYLEDMGALGSL